MPRITPIIKNTHDKDSYAYNAFFLCKHWLSRYDIRQLAQLLGILQHGFCLDLKNRYFVHSNNIP